MTTSLTPSDIENIIHIIKLHCLGIIMKTLTAVAVFIMLFSAQLYAETMTYDAKMKQLNEDQLEINIKLKKCLTRANKMTEASVCAAVALTAAEQSVFVNDVVRGAALFKFGRVRDMTRVGATWQQRKAPVLSYVELHISTASFAKTCTQFKTYEQCMMDYSMMQQQ